MEYSTTLICLIFCFFTAIAQAHGGHHASDKRPAEWALYHLEEEHRILYISNFDAGSFFTLHDFNNDGVWTADEVRKTYGLDDPSLKDVLSETKTQAVNKVFALFDLENTGSISRKAFTELSQRGVKLPDFHLGPGHHGDDEYEYEIHHFEKFHGPDTTEEELTHPEDIEHFRKHDEMEDEEIRIEKEQSQSIVEANIPLKFRKQQ